MLLLQQEEEERQRLLWQQQQQEEEELLRVALAQQQLAALGVGAGGDESMPKEVALAAYHSERDVLPAISTGRWLASLPTIVIIIIII